MADSASADVNSRRGAYVVSFSIFHIPFVIYHCAPSALPAMINDVTEYGENEAE